MMMFIYKSLTGENSGVIGRNPPVGVTVFIKWSATCTLYRFTNNNVQICFSTDVKNGFDFQAIRAGELK